MPYRRLPNTDISRIRALKQAIEKSNNTDFQNLALSASTLSEAKRVVRVFEELTLKYQETFDTQVKANIVFQDKVKAIRLYISHFIQVLYMSVVRNEIREEHLKFYNLDNQKLLVPELITNDQIKEWGELIINGEKERIANGGVPIYNPGIARVNVMYSRFMDGYKTQQIHQKATNRVQEKVLEYRDEVDKVILNIWNEVEKHFEDCPPNERINKNKEYGLVYYYRKGEVIE